MKQMIKRGLVYAIHTYIREISCQLSAVSRKLQVVRVLGDDGLFGACFQKSTQSPEPRTHSLEPCIPSKIVIICLLKCNLLVMQ